MTHIGHQTSSHYRPAANAQQYLALHANKAPASGSAPVSTPASGAGGGAAASAASETTHTAHTPIQPRDANLQTTGFANPPGIDWVDQLGMGSQPPPTEPLSDELTVEGLMEVWHTDDATYDLDGNGIVNVSDLLALLDQMDAG